MLKRIIALMLVVVMSALMAFGCGGGKVTTADGKVILNVQVGPEPDSIDPAHNEAVDGGTLLNHAFEGIMKLDTEGVPEVGQAASYKTNDDKTVYTFTLRDNLTWSDGQPLTAEDFIYSWKRAIDPATAAPYGYMLDVIANATDIMNGTKPVDEIGAKALDEKTIEITLVAATPYFLELLAFPTYFPVRKDIVEGNEAWATDPSTYISNGAFKLTKWEHNAEMVYEKNESYWDAKNIVPTEIHFKLIEDDNALLVAYQNGEIDFGDSMPNNEIAAWKEKPDFNVMSQLGTYFICFQTTKAPFDNPKVRKALSLAIDRNFIVEKIGQAGQVPAGAYVSIGLSDADSKKEFRDVGGDFYSVKAEDYEKNVEEAKKLLEEAGYPNGEGFPSFEYLLNVNTGHQQMAEAVQNMWKEKLGITCTIAAQEWNAFLNTRQNGDYSVSRHGWLADYNDPVSFLDMWVSGGGNNDAKWSNKDYDALISTVKTSSDQTVRFQAMHDAEKILMEELPVAPIYYYTDLYLLNPKMKGFYTSPLGFKYFHYAYMTK